jgi:hypothetical protein
LYRENTKYHGILRVLLVLRADNLLPQPTKKKTTKAPQTSS